jgi:hypothetical protein
LNDISEVLSASIIRIMRRPYMKQWFKTYEQVGPMGDWGKIEVRTDKARGPMGEGGGGHSLAKGAGEEIEPWKNKIKENIEFK